MQVTLGRGDGEASGDPSDGAAGVSPASGGVVTLVPGDSCWVPTAAPWTTSCDSALNGDRDRTPNGDIEGYGSGDAEGVSVGNGSGEKSGVGAGDPVGLREAEGTGLSGAGAPP